MIKVLVVDDSEVQREYFVYILNSDPEISVVAVATNGEEAVRAVDREKPDIVLMDVHMPKMDGIEATKKIMSTNPVPIVIMSASTTQEELKTTFKALEAGALAVENKPGLGNNLKSLITTIKLLSEIKVVRRIDPYHKVRPMHHVSLPEKKEIEIIAIGASTGGPPVLQELLQGLPENFPPVLVVQHIAVGFLPGLVEWLRQSTGKCIQIAQDQELVVPNKIYIAPDHFHMGLDSGGKIILSAEIPENGSRPSIAYLLRSVAKNFGKKALGILLTGMGKDGASALKTLKEKGGITLVQDKASSAVFGIPGEAVALDAACHVLSPQDMIQLIKQMIKS